MEEVTVKPDEKTNVDQSWRDFLLRKAPRRRIAVRPPPPLPPMSAGRSRTPPWSAPPPPLPRGGGSQRPNSPSDPPLASGARYQNVNGVWTDTHRTDRGGEDSSKPTVGHGRRRESSRSSGEQSSWTRESTTTNRSSDRPKSSWERYSTCRFHDVCSELHDYVMDVVEDENEYPPGLGANFRDGLLSRVMDLNRAFQAKSTDVSLSMKWRKWLMHAVF